MASSIPGRFNRMAQKLLSLKGGATITDAGAEVMWVVPLFHGAENRYLEGWDRFGTGNTQPAVVGQIQAVRFRNPQNSNVMVVVEKLTVSFSLPDVFDLQKGTGTTDGSVVLPQLSNNLDARGRNSATLIVSRSGLGGLPSANLVHRTSILASTAYEYVQDANQEITILPGDFYQIQLTSPNSNIDINFGLFWRERLLEESERT